MLESKLQNRKLCCVIIVGANRHNVHYNGLMTVFATRPSMPYVDFGFNVSSGERRFTVVSI